MIEISTPEPSPRGKSIRWNTNQERAVQNIGESARGFKVMHITVARFTSTVYEALMITSLVLAPASGTIDIIGSAYPAHATTFLFVSAGLSFVCGILLTIVKFAAFDQVSIAHKSAAAKYVSLESNVRRQLSLYRDNRPEPGRYLEWITASYDELFASAPLIPRGVQADYAAHAKEHGITIPDQVEDIIEINTDYGGTSQITVTGRNSVTETDLEVGAVAEVVAEVGGPKKVKRTNTMSHYSDLGKFGEGMMQYEMTRMLGLDK